MVQVINKAVFLRLGFGKKLWIAEGFRLRRQDGLHVHQNGINALGHQVFRMEVACAKHLEQGAQSAQVPEVPPRLRLGGSRGGRDVLAKGIALPQNAVRNAGDVGKPPVHDLPEQHIRPAVSRLIVKASFFRIHPEGGSSMKMQIRHLRAPAGNASEILPGKTLLECLNTDLVCDAINVAMREIFLQFVYGRTQSAFSEDGLPIGAGLEDLGKGLRSQVGTMFSTKAKGVRYMEMAEGYVTRMALDNDDQVIGYEFVKLGKMLEDIRHGKTPNEAYENNKGTYGRFDGAAKYIDPREE